MLNSLSLWETIPATCRTATAGFGNLRICVSWETIPATCRTATVGPQPLRRLITPIGFGDKSLKINPTVFDQTFSKKVCEQAFF
jgi:hypothetical protein